MLSFPRAWLRNPAVLSISGVAAAAACFGGGMLAAQDSGSTPASTPLPHSTPDARVGVTIPGLAIDTIAKGEASGGSSGSSIAVPPDGPACQATLPGVVQGSVVDLSKAGLTPRFPGAGFSLLSLNINALGSCDGGGEPQPMLDTSWRDDASSLDIWIHQSKSDPVANVIRGTNATFSSDGYAFQVSVGGGVTYAAGSGESTGSVPKPELGITAPGMPGQVDPRASALLQTVIAALAPDLSDACFAHQVTSGWDGLASLGIGDPRGAIPAGWEQENVSVTTYALAAKDCGGPPVLDGGSFDATYLQKAADGSFIAALMVSASQLPPNMDTTPGTISDYGLNWSDGRFQYGVYAKAEQPIARDVLVAIGRAMDPSLDPSKLTDQPSVGVIEPQPADAGGATTTAASPPNAVP